MSEESEQQKEQKTHFALPGMLLTVDMFGAPVPTFKIQGEEKVRTHFGGLISLLIFYVTTWFALLKLQHLLSKYNPQVNIFTEHDAFDESDVWDGNDEDDFMMAFAVVDFYTGEVKNNSTFVKWVGKYIDAVDGKKTYSETPLRKCNEQDFAKFYDPINSSKAIANKYKDLGGFICLDWKDIRLRANEHGSDYQAMDVVFMPCGTRDTLFGGKEDRIPDDCNFDREKLI